MKQYKVDLSDMTEQEVFDKVVMGMQAQQWRRATTLSGGVAYRSYNGGKCPGGHLIEDEAYDVEMEGKSWRMLVRDGVVGGHHKALVYALQLAHDQNQFSTRSLEDAIKSVGREAGLDVLREPCAS